LLPAGPSSGVGSSVPPSRLLALIALTWQSITSPCRRPSGGTVAVTHTRATFLAFFNSTIESMLPGSCATGLP